MDITSKHGLTEKFLSNYKKISKIQEIRDRRVSKMLGKQEESKSNETFEIDETSKNDNNEISKNESSKQDWNFVRNKMMSSNMR